MKPGRVLLGLLLALVILYAAIPVLADRVLPRLLARSGVDDSHFSFGYPGLDGVEVAAFGMRIGGTTIDGERLYIGYRLAQLVHLRVDSVTLARLTVRLGGDEEVPQAATGRLELPRFWALVPAERVTIDELFLASDEPAAEARGAVRFDPDALHAHLDVVSPLLALPLNVDAAAYPDGRLVVTVMEHDVAAPLLSLTAVPDNARGLLTFDGRLALAGTPLTLVAAYAETKLDSGSLLVQIKGTTPWPSAPEDLWRQVAATGNYSVELQGQMSRVPSVAASLDGDFSVKDGAVAGRLVAGSVFSAELPEASTTPAADSVRRISLTADATVEIDYSAGRLRVGDGLILTAPIAGSALSVRVRGAGGEAGPFELAVTALDGAPVVLATGAVGDVDGKQQLAVHGQLALTGKVLGFAASQLGVTKTSGQLVGEFDGVLPWPPQQDIELSNMSGKGRISLGLTGRAGAARTFETSFDAEYGLHDGLFDVTLAPGAHMLLADDGIEVTTIGAVTIAADVAKAQVAVKQVEFKLALPELPVGKRKVVLDKMWVTLQHITRIGDAVSADVVLRTHAGRDALPIRVRLDHELTRNKGRFVVAADWPAKKPLLAAQLPGFHAPYDLDEGELEIALEGNWDLADEPSFNGSGHVRVNGRRAHYEEYLVSGLVADLPLRFDGATYTVTDTPVAIESIDVGFELTQIKLRLAVADQIATVHELGGSVLGGRFASDTFDYALETDRAAVPVRIEGIDLGQVLALEGGDVQGSGVLDGVLPIRLDGEDASVADGHIAARPPGGTLVYKSPATASMAQTGMGFVFQALEDFRYELLDAKVVLSPAGDLALAVQMRGHNPVVENGRAIQFNLSVNESLPALFESLRAAEGITNSIEDRLAR